MGKEGLGIQKIKYVFQTFSSIISFLLTIGTKQTAAAACFVKFGVGSWWPP
jgi:hypothetical protein